MVTRRTNRGKTIDMDKIMAAQKKTPALGNMGVNGNGDVIGSSGEIVQQNEQRVRAYYKDNPKSSTVTTSLKEPIRKSDLPVDNVGAADTTKTLKENERVRQLDEPISGKDLAKQNGYEERILDDIDQIIDVISYTDDEEPEAPNPNPNPKRKSKKKTDET